MDRNDDQGLDRISTQWSLVGDPCRVVMRYGSAIRLYLQALIRDTHDADEVSQEFLAGILAKGLPRADPLRGRFRDYLKIAVRNAAMMHFRRLSHSKLRSLDGMERAVDDRLDERADAAWIEHWRGCVLAAAWRGLEARQRKTPGNLFHTALKLACDHPDDDSAALARRVEEATGRPMRADALRKQISRARKVFADLMVQEVSRTLENPTREGVEEELIELGLVAYVKPYWDACDE